MARHRTDEEEHQAHAERAPREVESTRACMSTEWRHRTTEADQVINLIAIPGRCAPNALVRRFAFQRATHLSSRRGSRQNCDHRTTS
jgi:hypothetical protein